MPYIYQSARAALSQAGRPAQTAGELNYQLTRLVVAYLNWKGKSYSTINEIMGVFACASQEFYRRVAADYEDIKRHENGDVY